MVDHLDGEEEDPTAQHPNKLSIPFFATLAREVREYVNLRRRPGVCRKPGITRWQDSDRLRTAPALFLPFTPLLRYPCHRPVYHSFMHLVTIPSARTHTYPLPSTAELVRPQFSKASVAILPPQLFKPELKLPLLVRRRYHPPSSCS